MITLDALKSNIDKYDQRTKFSLEEGSKFHGYKDPDAKPYLGYKVIKYYTVYRQIYISDNIMGTEAGKNIYKPDYKKEFDELQLSELINQNNIKEVWMWHGEGARPNWPSYDPLIHGDIQKHTSFIESNMSSPTTPDISNSDRNPNDLYVLDHTYVLYCYNFRRSQAEAVHDHGHQFECIYKYANQLQDGNMSLFLQDFSGWGDNNYTIPPLGRVGDCHHPPNTTVDYDYLNTTLVESDIEDWKPAGGPKKMVNVDTWGDLVYDWPGESEFSQRKESQWYLYWMQNMPGKDNNIPYHDEVQIMTNWWEFTADWDNSIKNEIGLYDLITEVTAGNLHNVLSDKLSTLKRLNLTGTIDARDFKTMRDSMPSLSIVDLSGVNIVAYTGTAGTNIVAGSFIYPANEIPIRAFDGKNSLHSIRLPLSATAIGENSLSSCGNLADVYLSDGITTIRTGAFWGSGSIDTIQIPASVTLIGSDAFTLSSASVEIDEANLNYSSIDGVLFNKTKDTLIHYPTTRSGAYSIPNDVVTITDRAFCSCHGITGVTIPSSVKTIGNYSFESCSQLTSIVIPNGVEVIKSGAFEWCGNVTELRLPASLKTVNNAAFLDLVKLSSIWVSSVIPFNLSSSVDVFRNVNRSTCTLHVPTGCVSNYQTAPVWQEFLNISAMPGLFVSENSIIFGPVGQTKSLIISSSSSWTSDPDQGWITVTPENSTGGKDSIAFTVTANPNTSIRTANVFISSVGFEMQTIAIKQFSSEVTLNITAGGLHDALVGALASITKLTLTGTIDARDLKTMRDEMPLLAEIDLSGVTIIAYTGTAGTAGAYNYAYPANSIPINAFYNPSTSQGKNSMETFVFPSSVVAIGNAAFNGCEGLTTISIPSSVLTIGGQAFFKCSGLITVNDDNPNYSSFEGVLFNKGKTELIQCPVSKTGNYTVPSSVTFIGNQSFWFCSELDNIIIPSSVTSIGFGVFQYCDAAINIPSSILTIGNMTFANYSGLLTVDDENPNYSALEGVLFNKLKTTLIQCPISKTDYYNIPSTVTTIGIAAFWACSLLNYVTIPPATTNISASAFGYCTSLNSVTIPQNISIVGYGAFQYCTELETIFVHHIEPIDLTTSANVFLNVNKFNCFLIVPYGSATLYRDANQWMDFDNIVEMELPIANAGPDQQVNEGVLVTLDGSASDEANGLPITYKWSAPEGFTLNSDTSIQPTFAAPQVVVDTPYDFVLVVNNGIQNSPLDTVVITVRNTTAISHFAPVWNGNGVDHMNINLVTARQNLQDLQEGDEVGIFDGSLCVGMGVLTAPLSATNILPVAVSRDDGTGNGYTVGNTISFKFWDQSTGTEITPVTPVYYTNNPAWSSDGKFAIGVTAFVDLDATGSSVPETLAVTNESLISGEDTCYNATQTITLAGSGTAVVFEDGSTATIIAGQSIRFLPGFHARNGSQVNAWITTNGTFCGGVAASPVLLPEGKSLQEIIATNFNKQVVKEKGLKIYPNPNNGKFMVELTGLEPADLYLCNLTGRIVYCLKQVNHKELSLNLSNLEQGIYLLKAVDREKQIVKKIIISKY